MACDTWRPDRCLWIQEELRGQRLKLIKVKGTVNATDVATKHVDAATLQKFMKTHRTCQSYKVSGDDAHGVNLEAIEPSRRIDAFNRCVKAILSGT